MYLVYRDRINIYFQFACMVLRVYLMQVYTIPLTPSLTPHTPTHTHTHTLDVSESFLQGGCVQLPQLPSWPGQGLCHDSQQVPAGSTIGPIPWIQWREMTLHTLTGTTEQCYSRTTAMSACIHVHTSLCDVCYWMLFQYELLIIWSIINYKL